MAFLGVVVVAVETPEVLAVDLEAPLHTQLSSK